jgi:hypothetical protein
LNKKRADPPSIKAAQKFKAIEVRTIRRDVSVVLRQMQGGKSYRMQSIVCVSVCDVDCTGRTTRRRHVALPSYEQKAAVPFADNSKNGPKTNGENRGKKTLSEHFDN